MSCLNRVMERISSYSLDTPLYPQKSLSQFSKKIMQGVQFIGSMKARKIIKLSIVGLLPQLASAEINQAIYFENSAKTAFFKVEYDSRARTSDVENIESICGFNYTTPFSSNFSPELIDDYICITSGASYQGMSDVESILDLSGFNTSSEENICMKNSLQNRYCEFTEGDGIAILVIIGVMIVSMGGALCYAQKKKEATSLQGQVTEMSESNQISSSRYQPPVESWS